MYGAWIYWIVAGVFASVFFKAAEMENRSPWIWSTASMLISICVYFVFSWGWVACIVCQIGLWLAITLFRVLVSLKTK